VAPGSGVLAAAPAALSWPLGGGTELRLLADNQGFFVGSSYSGRGWHVGGPPNLGAEGQRVGTLVAGLLTRGLEALPPAPPAITVPAPKAYPGDFGTCGGTYGVFESRHNGLGKFAVTCGNRVVREAPSLGQAARLASLLSQLAAAGVGQPHCPHCLGVAALVQHGCDHCG
jgi:hypothetical protein